MTDTHQIVDRIERANDERPYCPCGIHTTPVYRDGIVWLECASLSTRRNGRLARLIADVTQPAHVRARIADVPPANLELAS
jgi:hypothetical protein